MIINLQLLGWIPFRAVNILFKLKIWKQVKSCQKKSKKLPEAALGQPITNRCSILVKIACKTDELMLNEKDETFSAYIYRSKSKKYLIIGSESTLSSEYQILEASNPEGKFRVFQKRTRGLEYSASHYNDHFYIVTN